MINTMNMTNNNQNSYEHILKQTSTKKKEVFSFRKTYPAYIILVVFLIVSFFVRYFAESSIQTSLLNDFNKASSSIMNRLSAHYFKQIEVLKSMNGLYDTLVEVVQDYFELYATIPTRSYASILSVAYIPEVKHSDIDLYINAAKGLANYNYQLKTDNEKEKYLPFLNIVPERKNFHRMGFDISSQKEAVSAIYRARDENIMTATNVYTLRNPDTTGLYVFYPVYLRKSERSNLEERLKNFQGVLSLEINIKLFIKEALSGEGMEQRVSIPSDSTLIFEITGYDDNNKSYSFYKSENFELLSDYTPLLKSESKFTIADKEFTVHFYSMPNYGGKFQEILPNLSFAISVVLSFAFFGFVLTQLTNKARAQEIAERMTRSQRRIVDTSNDIIAVLDGDLNWKSMNPASLGIFGSLPDDMIGKNFGELLLEGNYSEQLINHFTRGGEDHTERIDIQMKKNINESVWISWSFTFSVADGLIYCIGRDVTLEKAAEADARLRTKQVETANILSKEANFSKSYFMKEMSHQLRNSLTGIEGSLQIIKNKFYDSEEELDMYVDLANSSSEELFTYVTDIEDASRVSDAVVRDFDIVPVSIANIFNKSIQSVNDEFKLKSEFNVSEEINLANILADSNTISQIFDDAFITLATNNNAVNFDVNIEINPYEGATEIQILTTGNKLVSEMIELYNKNSTNIIEALKFDKEDLLVRMTRMNSSIRLLRGSFKIETFGADDGNLISMIFKSNKKMI